MLVNIQDVIVGDRIRKDFGNIQELADDIKANGLINPPVVTPMQDGKCTLLAGERRLRALKLLGYQQIEVRPMSVDDDRHALEVENSENECRKPFTMRERYEMFLRRYEYLCENRGPLDHANTLRRSAEIYAGIGGTSRNQAKAIIAHESELDPQDIADWDEGKLSTNKLFNKLRDQLREAEAENSRLVEEAQEERNRIAGYELKLSRKQSDVEDLEEEVERLNSEIKWMNDHPVEIEVTPDDYEVTKRRLKDAVEKLTAARDEADELRYQINQYREDMEREQENARAQLERESTVFVGHASNFLKSVGGYAYLADRLDELEGPSRKNYVVSVRAIYAWAQNILSITGEEF